MLPIRRAWTVPELAHLSAMSRPSFARNFELALGQSPMQYLTDWRLTLARDYLLAGELTLEARHHTSPRGWIDSASLRDLAWARSLPTRAFSSRSSRSRSSRRRSVPLRRSSAAISAFA
jgi:AraC-like DNA-binding protein